MTDSAEWIPPSAQRRLELRRLFEQARQLLVVGHAEDARRRLAHCAAEDPGNLIYVDHLLQAVARSPQRKVRGRWLGERARLRRALGRSAWEEILRLGPQELTNGPEDGEILVGLANACGRMGFDEAQLRYIRAACARSPDDPEVNQAAGQAWAEAGYFEQALSCWQQLIDSGHAENSQDLQRRCQALEPNSAMRAVLEQVEQSAAADGTLPWGESLAGSPAGQLLVSGALWNHWLQPRRAEPENCAQPDLSDLPQNLESYLATMSHWVLGGQCDQAIEVLTQATPLAQAMRLDDLREDLTLIQAWLRVEQARRLADTDSADGSKYADVAARVSAEAQRYTLELLAERAQRYPEHQLTTFWLGRQLQGLGRYREALPRYLSIEAADPSPWAQLYAGECLQHLRQFDQALKQYQRAYELAREANQPEAARRSRERYDVLQQAMHPPGT